MGGKKEEFADREPLPERFSERGYNYRSNTYAFSDSNSLKNFGGHAGLLAHH